MDFAQTRLHLGEQVKCIEGIGSSGDNLLTKSVGLT